MKLNVDLGSWTILKISGSEKFEYLDGIIPNNLEDFKLERGVFLTPKAKIQTYFWIQNNNDHYLLFTPPSQRDTLISILLKYKLSLDIKLEDVAEELPKLYLVDGGYTEGLGNCHFSFNKPNDEVLDYNQYYNLLTEIGQLPLDKAINENPFEFGFGNSIHLSKGCFLGQEPLSRMWNIGKPRTFIYSAKMTNDSNELKLNEHVVGEVLSRSNENVICKIKASITEFDKIVPKLINIHRVGSYPRLKRV